MSVSGEACCRKSSRNLRGEIVVIASRDMVVETRGASGMLCGGTFVAKPLRTVLPLNQISKSAVVLLPQASICVALYDYDGKNEGDLKLRWADVWVIPTCELHPTLTGAFPNQAWLVFFDQAFLVFFNQAWLVFLDQALLVFFNQAWLLFLDQALLVFFNHPDWLFLIKPSGFLQPSLTESFTGFLQPSLTGFLRSSLTGFLRTSFKYWFSSTKLDWFSWIKLYWFSSTKLDWFSSIKL